MNFQLLSTSFTATPRLIARRCLPRPSLFRRAIANNAPERQSKYADKLRQKAEETGLSVSQLIEKANAEKAEKRRAEAKKLTLATESLKTKSSTQSRTPSSSQSEKISHSAIGERKDAPPFRALSSILNLSRLLSTPHTAEQIAGLWTAYHASRSGGTGRGYVCATIPLATYNKMEKSGRAYPSFVVPVPRVQQDPIPTETAPGEENVAHEFYYLQWDFHAAPPVPSPSEDPFAKPVQISELGCNPQSATILFTPLQEYKMRGSFATPYLVLTVYTDLAATHGIVLLRGEITPSTAAGQGSPDRYMISQEDAQLLAMALQKFYLWNEELNQEQHLDGKNLLRTFHENPQDFKWEVLLKFSNLTA